MIEVQVRPNEIPLGGPVQIELVLTNTGSSPCTSILMDVDLPLSLPVIQGLKHIELAKLAGGMSYMHPLIVKPRQTGKAAISLQGFSFRGPNGKVQTIRDVELIVQVVGVEQQHQIKVIPWLIKIREQTLSLGEWSSLTGQVYNRTKGEFRDLSIDLDGSVQCERVRLEEIILPESGVSFQIQVLPLQSGERVPVILQLLGPSGTLIYTQKAYLNVREKPASSDSHYDIHINDSKGIVIGDNPNVKQTFRKEGH